MNSKVIYQPFATNIGTKESAWHAAIWQKALSQMQLATSAIVVDGAASQGWRMLSFFGP